MEPSEQSIVASVSAQLTEERRCKRKAKYNLECSRARTALQAAPKPISRNEATLQPPNSAIPFASDAQVGSTLIADIKEEKSSPPGHRLVSSPVRRASAAALKPVGRSEGSSGIKEEDIADSDQPAGACNFEWIH